MRRSPAPDPHLRLQPPGRRWGFGAHSVVPYLTHALNARPGEAVEDPGAIRNPVFPQMDKALRTLRQRH